MSPQIKRVLSWAGVAACGLLGAAAGGFAVAAFSLTPAPLPDGSLPTLPPDPLGALAGLVVFAGLALWARQSAGGDGARPVYEGLYARMTARGFAGVASSAGLGKGDGSTEAALALADRLVAQANADRKELEKYKDALAKHTDSSLSQKLKLETHHSQVQTKKTSMAVVFTDIRGFTKMSETLTTEEVVAVLNDYFAIAAEVVHANQGRINKFIGDAVMAVFEDPEGHITGSQASKNAVHAGIELVARTRMQRRVWHERIATPFEIDLGCGVNHGPLIFGNLGSPERMEYTAIGDTVNFASRLCSKAAGGQVRISESVFKLVEGYFSMTPEDPISVKGKSGEFKTWLVEGVLGGKR